MPRKHRSKHRILNSSKLLKEPRKEFSKPQRVTRIKDEETLTQKALGKRNLKARRIADGFIMNERGITTKERYDLILGTNSLVQRQRENLIKKMNNILLEEERDAAEQETVELKF